ncbi:MAG TPA: Hpt domain-containing protein [Rhodocyclaceae bacterium]
MEDGSCFARTDEAPHEAALAPGVRSIAGLDPDAGLKHLRGRSESYMRLLKRFAETRADEVDAMRTHLAARSYDELASVVHNVKGVAGFLGAAAIHGLAMETATALRRSCGHGEIERLAEALMAAQLKLAEDVLALDGKTS